MADPMIDDWVDENDVATLVERLGWTDGEYQRWVATGEQPRQCRHGYSVEFCATCTVTAEEAAKIPGCFALDHQMKRTSADRERAFRFARLLGVAMQEKVWGPQLAPGTLGHYWASNAAWEAACEAWVKGVEDAVVADV